MWAVEGQPAMTQGDAGSDAGSTACESEDQEESAAVSRRPAGEVTADAVPGLWFGVLGPLEVRRDGRLVALRGPRERALLGVLLSERNRVVSGSRLVDGVWAAAAPPSANKTLQSYISRLRGLLEPDRPPSGSTVLITVASGYTLRADDDAVDVALFERLVGQARLALTAGAPELGLARLERALGLWRGDAYQDLGDAGFAVADRGRLAELRLAAVADRVDAAFALGRASDLVGELQRLVAEHPLRERLWSQLMIALYESGRQAEALEAYRAARARLVDELAVEPGPQLQELNTAILAARPSLLPAAVPAQGLPAGLGGDHNPLVGREAELRSLERAWGQAVGEETGGVVVVEGEAGMGASRLVAEFARRVAARGGVVVRDVVAVEVLTQTAAERPVLVVLDDHAGVDPGVVERLVTATGRLPVLVVVTVRPGSGPAQRPLGAGGAHGAQGVLRLGPLGGEQVRAVVAG